MDILLLELHGHGDRLEKGSGAAHCRAAAACVLFVSGVRDVPGSRAESFAFSFIWERTRGCDRSVFFSFCLFFWMQPYWVVNDPDAMCGLRRVKHVASSSSREDPGSYPLLGA